MKNVSVLLALTAILAIPVSLHAQQSLPLKLLVLPSPSDPEVFMGDGKQHVAYELLLANFTNETIRIDSLDAAANHFDRDQLKTMFSTIAGNYGNPQDPILKPAEAGIIFLFRDGPPPPKWDNTLTIEADGKPESRQTVSVESHVSKTKPIVISSPLRGKNWWTPNGPANDSIHRRIVIAFANHLGLPERFAVDWVQVGADGETFTGKESDNHSYHAYGNDILAVADGKVVSIKDGIAENVPQSPKMAVPITLETIGGNNVVEDLGGGRYAFYAHMIPGSLAVKPGDQVKRGQILGKLGNSGNSSEPHLHFHVCDGPNPLLCNGQPFEIDHFTGYDYTMEMKDDHPVKFAIGAPHQVTNEIFMNKDLGDF
jgi:hypothetical protein